MSIDTREIARWLLVIGVYAAAFLAISVLVQRWVFGRVIHLVVFAAVSDTVLKPEVVSLLRLVDAVMKRKKDVTVVQTER